MNRPDILTCVNDDDWKEWYNLSMFTNRRSTPPTIVKNFCLDCTPEYFNDMVKRDRCFQSKFLNEELGYDEVMDSIDRAVGKKRKKASFSLGA